VCGDDDQSKRRVGRGEKRGRREAAGEWGGDGGSSCRAELVDELSDVADRESALRGPRLPLPPASSPSVEECSDEKPAAVNEGRGEKAALRRADGGGDDSGDGVPDGSDDEACDEPESRPLASDRSEIMAGDGWYVLATEVDDDTSVASAAIEDDDDTDSSELDRGLVRVLELSEGNDGT
jgi:hypothetical protein